MYAYMHTCTISDERVSDANDRHRVNDGSGLRYEILCTCIHAYLQTCIHAYMHMCMHAESHNAERIEDMGYWDRD